MFTSSMQLVRASSEEQMWGVVLRCNAQKEEAIADLKLNCYFFSLNTLFRQFIKLTNEMV